HFSGVFLRENRGVPIRYVTSRLQKVLSPSRPTDEGQLQAPPVPKGPADGPARADGPAVTVSIPLQISVSAGARAAGVAGRATGGGPVAVPPAPPAGERKPAVPATINQAVADARERLKGRPEVLAVREGCSFRNGWITPDPAVVVVLKDRAT